MWEVFPAHLMGGSEGPGARAASYGPGHPRKRNGPPVVIGELVRLPAVTIPLWLVLWASPVLAESVGIAGRLASRTLGDGPSVSDDCLAHLLPLPLLARWKKVAVVQSAFSPSVDGPA
jgi:hypothetical protein